MRSVLDANTLGIHENHRYFYARSVNQDIGTDKEKETLVKLPRLEQEQKVISSLKGKAQ